MARHFYYGQRGRASNSLRYCALCKRLIERDGAGVLSVYWRKKKPHCSPACACGKTPHPSLLTDAELWGVRHA